MSTATTTKTDFAASDSVVNGIDTDTVHALIESVEANPAKGMTHWRVASTWEGGAHSRAQVDDFMIGGAKVPRHFSIDIDEPCELGGSNRFANPQEHLIAALNACMTVGYVAQCAVSLSRASPSRPKARSTSGASSASIQPWREAMRNCTTRCASRATAPRSSLPRSTRR